MTLIFLFVLSVIASFAIFVVMITTKYSSVAVITGAITGMLSTFATIVLSIFKLPEIIAKYLFNKKEDAQMNEVIRNIQQYELDAVKLEKTAIADAEKEMAGRQKSDSPFEASPNASGMQPERLDGQDGGNMAGS